MKNIIRKVLRESSNEKFYKIFLQNREGDFGVAEYNLYFYFLISYFPNSYRIRILNYKNTAKFFPLFEKIRKKYHYCSYHSYMSPKIANFFNFKFFLKLFPKLIFKK
jgi:hypothetical protein